MTEIRLKSEIRHETLPYDPYDLPPIDETPEDLKLPFDISLIDDPLFNSSESEFSRPMIGRARGGRPRVGVQQLPSTRTLIG